MSSARQTFSNALLALPARDRTRLFECLKPVSLSLGDVLYHPGKPMRQVYFPVSCLISLLTVIDGDSAIEVGMIGREGMVGTPLLFGIRKSPMRALVQGSGMALRMSSGVFLLELERTVSLRKKVSGFTHEMTLQVAQTAACNRFHPVHARLARWLLMTRDRLGSDEFPLTHKFLADMLGVRRAGVSDAASGLQRRRLIEYSRGKIRILDEAGLEAASCSCYKTRRGIYRAASMQAN